MYIRLATVDDALQLMILNEQFNGTGETSLEHIKALLTSNEQEVVIVAEENDILVGFVCLQIKKSFCYKIVTIEITEVFVREDYRRKGIASQMLIFAETLCKQNYSISKFELQTGKNNMEAQALYQKIGYKVKNILFSNKACVINYL